MLEKQIVFLIVRRCRVIARYTSDERASTLIKRNLIAFNFSDTSRVARKTNHFILLFAAAYKKSVSKFILFIDISMAFNTLCIKRLNPLFHETCTRNEKKCLFNGRNSFRDIQPLCVPFPIPNRQSYRRSICLKRIEESTNFVSRGTLPMCSSRFRAAVLALRRALPC